MKQNLIKLFTLVLAAGLAYDYTIAYVVYWIELLVLLVTPISIFFYEEESKKRILPSYREVVNNWNKLKTLHVLFFGGIQILAVIYAQSWITLGLVVICDSLFVASLIKLNKWNKGENK